MQGVVLQQSNLIAMKESTLNVYRVIPVGPAFKTNRRKM
jgi:hypothetical protein